MPSLSSVLGPPGRMTPEAAPVLHQPCVCVWGGGPKWREKRGHLPRGRREWVV